MKKLLIAIPINIAIFLDLILYAESSSIKNHVIGDISKDLFINRLLMIVIPILALIISIIINKKYVNPESTKMDVFLLVLSHVLIAILGCSFFTLIYNS